jgi:protoporphyrin/coproporphyrin ferrochelatase
VSRAVLLLAYGSPDSVADIPAYLSDVRGGRETPQRLLEEITSRYQQIGGRSPLLDITRSAGRRLSEATGLPVYTGMRHWHPRIKDAVAEMSAAGVERCIAICMAPHYSVMSVGAYRARLDDAMVSSDCHMAVDFVESWHTEPHYLDGLAQNTREALRRFTLEERDEVKVIFTAHSLPEAILERGDPYPQQLAETSRLVAERLELAPGRWEFSFQSAAQTGTPWLGPQIEALVPELARRGERNLVISPVGFIADHVEVLYDLDIGVQRIARAAGVHVERAPMLNDSPALVAALASIVRECLDRTHVRGG